MKQKKQDAAKADITTLSIIPGTILLSAVMLIAFAVLFIVLNVQQMIDLPLWIERIIGTASEEINESDSFSQAFLDSLQGSSQPVQKELIYLETDSETLLSLLRETQTTDAFYQSCTLKRIASDGKTVTQQIFRIVSGGREHTEVLANGQLAKTITVNADAIFIAEQGDTRLFSRNDSVFTPESELGLPSLSRMHEMLRETENGTYSLRLSADSGTTCIRAEFTDTISGTRDIYDILPDCGLIFAAESYLPGQTTPYYVLTTDSLLSDITGFDESIFAIPIP